MKEQMVVDVIVRIKSRQWQPRERRWKTAVADRLPNDPAPLGMIVTIKISAADRRGGELKPPKYNADRNYADDKLNSEPG